MNSSLTKVTLTVCIVICSILIANVTNIISVERQPTMEALTKSFKDETRPKSDVLQMGDRPDHLMWFLQVGPFSVLNVLVLTCHPLSDLRHSHQHL